MFTRKDCVTFLLVVLFWATATAGYAWAHGLKGREGLADAAFKAAVLPFIIGFIVLKFGRPLPGEHIGEPRASSRQFAFIMIAASVFCGIIALLLNI